MENMAILDFIKPDKVVMLNETDNVSTFEFRPLEPGYGITIGNAIRRVLLSSLEGYAICSIKIDGIDHEFSTIPGVITDVSNIILNLKQVRFKRKKNINEDKETIRLHINNTTKVTAKYLNTALKYFEVLNKDLLIAETDETADFYIEININKGRGYVPADESYNENMPLGTLPIDCIYTPIKSVKYAIEQYRVGQRTDYEKLTIEIATDGSITPKESLTEVAKILIFHFELFSDKFIDINNKKDKDDTLIKNENNSELTKQILDKKLQDLNFSVRSVNCLKQAEIITVRDLVKFNKMDLLKFRNFGRKSLNELDEFLEKNGLSFGMDLSSIN